jgi:hypothetical protein
MLHNRIHKSQRFSRILSQINAVHPLPFHLRSILIVSFLLRLVLPSGSSFKFPRWNPIRFSLFPHPCYMIQNVTLAQRRLLISRLCLGATTSYIDVSGWTEILSGSETHTRVYIQHEPPYLIRRVSTRPWIQYAESCMVSAYLPSCRQQPSVKRSPASRTQSSVYTTLPRISAWDDVTACT